MRALAPLLLLPGLAWAAHLQLPDDALPGATRMVLVRGAPPYATLEVYASDTLGDGPCLGTQAGSGCLSLVNPTLLGSATAGGQGDAALSLTLPTTPGEVHLQAVVGTNPSSVSEISTVRLLLPGDDYDGDGLTNLQEWLLGTSLAWTSSDGDGLSDALEVAAGLSPHVDDSDLDGQPDGADLFPLVANPDAFTPDDARISDPSISLRDPEFHPDTHQPSTRRMVHGRRSGPPPSTPPPARSPPPTARASSWPGMWAPRRPTATGPSGSTCPGSAPPSSTPTTR